MDVFKHKWFKMSILPCSVCENLSVNIRCNTGLTFIVNSFKIAFMFLPTGKNTVDLGDIMSLTATPVTFKLNFAKFASQVRACGSYLDEDEHEIQQNINEQVSSWVCSFTKVVNNCEVILLESANGHPNWNQRTQEAIISGLRHYRNTAGNVIRLVVS